MHSLCLPMLWSKTCTHMPGLENFGAFVMEVSLLTLGNFYYHFHLISVWVDHLRLQIHPLFTFRFRRRSIFKVYPTFSVYWETTNNSENDFKRQLWRKGVVTDRCLIVVCPSPEWYPNMKMYDVWLGIEWFQLDLHLYLILENCYVCSCSVSNDRGIIFLWCIKFLMWSVSNQKSGSLWCSPPPFLCHQQGRLALLPG